MHNKNLFLPFIAKEKPDIFCLQETKAEESQLPVEIAKPQGYFSYFSHSKNKKGYSGVAIYSKTEPKKVEYGIGISKFDDEGRILVAYYDEFVLLNVYFPNGGGGEERLKYKLEFYDAFLLFIDSLKKQGNKVIFCGDVNTAHEAIDLARPKENEDNTGFLPEEREWIDEVIAHGYRDVFRDEHPNKKDVYTFWDMKTRSRERNVGWRIDYFFVSNNFLVPSKSASGRTEWGRVKMSANILSEVLGSDHCPISLLIEL